MIGSDQYANARLDAIYGDGRAAGFPSSLRIKLFIGNPLSGGVEVTGAGYVQVTYANTTANWPAATGRVKTHATDVTFPVSTGPYPGSVTHWAHADPTGHLITWAALQNPIDVLTAGTTVRLPAGAMTINN